MLSQLALPLYFKLTLGVPADQLRSFTETELSRHPSAVFAANAIVQVGSFLLPALLFAAWAGPTAPAFLGMRAPGKKVQFLWVVLLAVALLFVVSPLATWLKNMDLGNTAKALDEQRQNMISSYLMHGTIWNTIKSVFLIAAVPAICEEVFFRGALMKMIHSLVPRWWFSIGLSALVFAAFHTSISEFVPILVAGVLLGCVYYLTSSLWLCMLLHFVFNGLQALGGIYADPSVERNLESGAVIAGIFAVAVALAACCLYALYRSRTPLPKHWSVVRKSAAGMQWDMDRTPDAV